jgi:hypothetical protein
VIRLAVQYMYSDAIGLGVSPTGRFERPRTLKLPALPGDTYYQTADRGRRETQELSRSHTNSLRPRQENLQTLSNPNRQDANSRLPSLPIDNTLRAFESDRPSPQQRSLNGGHPVQEVPRLAQPTPSAEDRFPALTARS